MTSRSKALAQSAFEGFAKGDFERGLRNLALDPAWRDDDETLEGPFWLGFPDAPGWGEAFFFASLLKRHAVASGTQIEISANDQALSILQHDPAFRVLPHQDIASARPPLAILRHALTGYLLDSPFAPITESPFNPEAAHNRARIGIAWESVGKSGAIGEKSIPLTSFLSMLTDLDVEVVSFQRHLTADARGRLNANFKYVRIIETIHLDGADQSFVAAEIAHLHCMVTISTTTAHIAASLGVPVVLLSAKRPGQQWFWRAQAEHSACFYPSVDVVLGGPNKDDWWKACIDDARGKLAALLNSG